MAETREIGGTGVRVPAVGFGTSGIGGMPDTYGYGVDEERALATVRAVLALPDGFLDSSRLYGMGRSEERIGKVVRELGGWPEGRVLSTKLDRDAETGRFDAGAGAAVAGGEPGGARASTGWTSCTCTTRSMPPTSGRSPARRRAGGALPHAGGGAGGRGRAGGGARST